VKPSAVISVDPGSKGAAVIAITHSAPLNATTRQIHNYTGRRSVIEALDFNPTSSIMLIEKVWASPIMSPSGAFTFGGNYEGWIMAALAFRIPVFAVTPQAWQKVIFPNGELDLLTDGVVRNEGKKREDARKVALKNRATFLFPAVKVTLTNADALLISRYAEVQLAAGKPLGEEIK